MPSTYNGIGTTYFRRKNRFTREATCEFCRKYGTLTSYDTTLVFSIFFLPVIPLGKKHIADQCPRCTRHRVMSTADWDALQLKAREHLNTFKTRQPSDDDFRNALFGILQTQQAEALPALVTRMRQVMPPSAERELLVGDASRRLGDLDGAEATFKRALSIADTAAARAALANVYLAKNKPDDAKPHLKAVLDGQDNGNLGLANALAQAYQAQGRHAEALAVFDQMTKAAPELASDKEIARSRALSEKAGVSGKPIKPRLFVGADGSVLAASKGPWRGLAIAAAILLVAAGVYGGISILKAGGRTVHLVGDLDRAYKVTIDGKPYDVPAHGEIAIKLAEGPHQLAIADEQYLGVPTSFDIAAGNFFTRPFSKQAFVVNPDGTSLIFHEIEMYGPSNAQMSNGIKPEIQAGGIFYTFEGIDDDFTDPPASVKIDKATGQAFRHHVYAYRKSLPPRELIRIAREEKGDAVGVEITLRLLRDLQNKEILLSLPTFVPTSDLLPVLRERAKRQPEDTTVRDLIRAMEKPVMKPGREAA